MTLQDAREYFGTYSALAAALGLTKGAITQWGGEIPDRWQIEIHEKTKGALKADAPILSKYRKILRTA